MVRGPEGTPVRGSVRQVVSRRVLSEGDPSVLTHDHLGINGSDAHG